jgi:hypothetical protein
LRGWRFKASFGKKLWRPLPISTNKQGMVVHTCHPSYEGGISRKILVQMDWVKSSRPNMKNN